MGRPANSLIALDEVFDKVENTLRKAPDLEESFATFDAINKDVVSLIPVMQRLQAKLILKALFVLSLDGDGTTASEIAAAMLIFNEADPAKSRPMSPNYSKRFVSVFPDQLNRKEEDGAEIRFSFKVAGKDDLNSALLEKTAGVPDEVVPRILSRVAKDFFSDWQISVTDSDESFDWTDCHINWRGGQRKGRVSGDGERKIPRICTKPTRSMSRSRSSNRVGHFDREHPYRSQLFLATGSLESGRMRDNKTLLSFAK